MRSILRIFSFFAILTVAVLGCLLIFEINTSEESVQLGTKILAAIVLLGGCSALMSFLLSSMNGKPPE